MKRLLLAAALTLGLAGPSMAVTCSDTFALGVLGPPALRPFGNTFAAPGLFNDCYDFSLASAANGFGVALEFDHSPLRDIDVWAASLSGAGLAATMVDGTPEYLSFSDLAPGAYRLVISGRVTGRSGGPDLLTVGYAGLLATTRSAQVSAVPEPESAAMLALGLGTVGWLARRRRSR